MLEELEQFAQMLDYCPCIYKGNPLNLIFMDEAYPVESAEIYLKDLASPRLLEERREFMLGGADACGFPIFEVLERPDPHALSEVLFERFARAQELLLTQGEIAAYLARRALELNPDIIILVIADGLSYYDLPDGEAEPCLVAGATVTEFGYREVVGKPSLSQRLFNLGYRNQKAFTYFDVSNNELASDLHSTFGDSQIVRVTQFDDILRHPALRGPRGYFQVTTAGLDGLCHQHRDRPPVKYYRDLLLERFADLVETCARNNRKVLACLTSDHGILWRDHLSKNALLIDAATAQDNFHPRLLKGSLLRAYAQPAKSAFGPASLLKYPYLTRRLRGNEWGVHGGISAWESIVPLKIVVT